jgi:hypothetical protein
MQRKLFAILIVVMIIFIPGFMRVNDNNLDSIINKVSCSGGKIEKIIVEGHGTIKSNDNISDIANNIYKNAGLEDKLKRSEDESSIAIKGSNSYIKVMKMPTEHRYYISFELSQHEHKENINNIRETIFKGFSHYNPEIEVSYLLIAKYSRCMTRLQMKKSASAILASAGCKSTTGMCDRNLVSYHAYMPELARKIKMGDAYTNINLGMRAVKEKNYTYLFIGSPIIEVEY